MNDWPEFWRMGRIASDNVALIDPVVGKRSYGDLAAGIASMAARLDRYAEQIGTDRLLIAVELSARNPVIEAYLAALSGGHVVLVVAPEGFATGGRMFDAYEPNLLIKMTDNDCSLTPLSEKPADLHPDLALLLSTSGTTGDPKLVRLSAANICSNAAAIAEYLQLKADDRAVTTLPLHYIFGLSVLHAHLCVGAAVVLTDLSVIDAGFATLVAATGGTSISVVPHQIDLLLANGFLPDTFPSLRHIAQAGGKLAPAKVRDMAEMARQGGWSFFVMYGQTEASPRMAYLPPDDAAAHPDSVGLAIPGGHFDIRDATGAVITEHSCPGDLTYSGPNVMMGYATTRSDLALPKTAFELATGDVAEKTAAGYIRIVGRSARFVKLFGLRISLDQAEVLLGDAGITAFAVAVDETLVLMLPDVQSQTTATDLVAKAYKLPATSVHAAHLTEIPTLPSGKVNYKVLSTMARAAKPKPMQHAAGIGGLRKVLAETTRRDAVGPDDSFTSLGGDSLGYLQVQIYLERVLGVAPKGWENMTLRQLAALQPDTAKLDAFWHAVDIDVALRVVSITFVILVHIGRLPVGGGTWLLIVLMGFSFARFQRPRLINGQFFDVAMRMLHPILPVYALLLFAYFLTRGEVANGYIFLFANALPPGPGSLLTVLWFVSLYVQLVVAMIVCFMFAPIRRAQQIHPWLSSAVIFAVGTVVSIGFLWLSDDPFPNDRYAGISGSPLALRSLVVCFPILLLGMMVYFAKSRQQLTLTVAGLVVTCLIFPATSFSQPFILGIGGLLLLWGKAIPLPARAARAVNLMAASTLFVYLLHNLVVHFVRNATPILDIIGLPAAATLVVLASFVAGYLAKRVFDVFDRGVSVWWRTRRATAARTG